MSLQSSGDCCAVRGCQTRLKVWPDQECCEHSPRTKRECCCVQRFRFYRVPSDEQTRRVWLRNLNLKSTEKKLHVCSGHFVDKKPTEENPYPTLRLGGDRAPEERQTLQTTDRKLNTLPVLPTDVQTLIVVKEEVPVEWNSSLDSDVVSVKEEPEDQDQDVISRVVPAGGRCKSGEQREMEPPTSSAVSATEKPGKDGKRATDIEREDSFSSEIEVNVDNDEWLEHSSESEADGADSWGESRSSESELDDERLAERLPKTAKPNMAELKFSCNICRERFPGLISLENHVRIHTGEQSFSSSDCDKSEERLPGNAVEKRFECYFCTNRYTRQGDLIRHIRVHTGEKPFDCEVCGKKFSHKTLLRTHMRIHTGEKPFECNVCGKKFSQRANFITHKRVHTGEKPFECSFCGKCFNRGTRFKIHLRVHTGEKPYDCDVCGAQFKERGNLKMHMRVHTGEKPFTCDVCNKKFTRQGNLKRHLKIHNSTSAADGTEKE